MLKDHSETVTLNPFLSLCSSLTRSHQIYKHLCRNLTSATAFVTSHILPKNIWEFHCDLWTDLSDKQPKSRVLPGTRLRVPLSQACLTHRAALWESHPRAAGLGWRWREQREEEEERLMVELRAGLQQSAVKVRNESDTDCDLGQLTEA